MDMRRAYNSRGRRSYVMARPDDDTLKYTPPHVCQGAACMLEGVVIPDYDVSLMPKMFVNAVSGIKMLKDGM